MLPRNTRLTEVREAIALHPGTIANSRWEGLRRVCAILQGNFEELRRHVNRPSSDVRLALELIQNVSDTNLQEDFGLEIDRLLHNAVAAALTLVDHTRRVVEKYPGSDFAAEYQRRLELVKANNVVAFVKDLRNLTQHQRLPYTVHSASITPNTFDYALQLPTDALLGMTKWSAGSRAYLNSAREGQLSLIAVVDEYESAIASLYDWLFAQFWPLHDADVKGANLLIEEYNRVLTGVPNPPVPPF